MIAEADGTMVLIVDTSEAPAGTDRRKHRKVHYQEASDVSGGGVFIKYRRFENHHWPKWATAASTGRKPF